MCRFDYMQYNINKGTLNISNGKNIYFEHAVVDVQKPTIIFLHDSLGCSNLWRDFPQQVAELFQCNYFLYDRIGYGKSDPMDTSVRGNDYMDIEAMILLEIISLTGLKDVRLFGHSDGGTIALLAAAKPNNPIQSVVCEAGHIFVEEVTLTGVRASKEAYNTTSLAEKLVKYHGDKVETLFKAWIETWLSSTYRTWNISEEITQIACPILFIQGTNDEYGSEQQLHQTLKQVTGPKFGVLIPEIGHSPHKEAPQTVIKILTNHKKELLF